jgi:hypothetical protein
MRSRGTVVGPTLLQAQAASAMSAHAILADVRCVFIFLSAQGGPGSDGQT